ncbi:hypothetical protein BJ322DRAFT_526146 [Thelephora terrestris]|uniref:Uncharacterized protein n=1 Tax=Thelephora terrestris TaxID=56493 RepID=A0A9P6HLX2_9AGAM|nr:hypothetical protein BJ322DRAFT_526146 [Thelephora terrestris]
MAQPAWKIYEERMERLRYGHALWEPSPTSQHTRIRIGDVGFIREGRFHFMFSAALPRGNRTLGVDVPSTFVELTVRDGETQQDQPRAPGCVGAMTYRRVVAGLRLSFTEPVIKSLEPGLNFSVEHTGESGAALTTRHESYNEDAQLDMRFRKYTKLHYESWVEFARLKEYGENLRPVLVSGFDMTKDFAMMAYSNSNTSVQAGADCHTPMFGSASVSAEFTWRTVCTPHFKDGPKERRPPGLRPSQAGAGTPPTEYNQCIFVRYYTMRSEFGIFPRVIRAAAGPKDLGSGENRGETFPELTVRSGAGPVSAERDPGEQWSLATDDTGPEPDMVIRNEPYDEDRDSWDIVADYVFQNSNAKRVLMHHKDLAGILVVGDITSADSNFHALADGR